MHNKEFDFIAVSMANMTGIGGRATADRLNLGWRLGKRGEDLKRFAGYGVFGLAIALLPVQ